VIIEIPEDVSGKERKRLLAVMPLVYALEKYKSKVEAAKFLGISDRAIRYAVHRHPELFKFRHMGFLANHLPKEQRAKYIRMRKRYPSG